MPKTAPSALPAPVSPNALDGRGFKTGVWTEDDPHGGTVSGGYVDGSVKKTTVHRPKHPVA